ncbi:MAG: GrpB family protein [Cytophagaceae bacterium]|nr:GrpB family protein [Gemmatimonadaceae bacterium]
MSRANHGATIVLAEHDPAWTSAFSIEAASVAATLGDALLALHHVGSTAIVGIRAKPVIDMLAVVTDVSRLDAMPNVLAGLGYEAKGEFGIPGRRYFRKDSEAGVRTHQIHAFGEGSREIQRHVDFRDYLRAHPVDARAYEALKLDLAVQCNGDMELYGDGKTMFIRDIERRAALWRRVTP